MSRQLFAAVLVVCTVTLHAQMTVTYAPFQTFSGGFAAKGIAIGDVAGGALPDICLLDTASRNVHVIGNNGLATLPTEFDLSTSSVAGNGPTSITLEDMDGDGDQDIVVGGSLVSAPNVRVFLHQGASYPSVSVMMSSVTQVHAADLDGDGLKDLIRGARYARATAAASGAVTFAVEQVLNIGGLPASAVTSSADVNGDGKSDILWLSSSGTAMQFWCALNTTTAPGAPTFSPATSMTIGHAAGSANLATADMNDDGITDVVAVAQGTQWQSEIEVQTFLGTANGIFFPLPPIAFCAIPSTAPVPVIADLDGDGKKDAMLRYDEAPIGGFAVYWVNVIRRLRNDGQGRLVDAAVVSVAASATTYSGPPQSFYALGDLDLDGDVDLVRQSSAINGLSPNQTPLGLNNDVLLASISPAASVNAQSITIISGDNRVVSTSAPTDNGFVVEVRDGQGLPVAGESIALNVTSGAASFNYFVSCSTVTSDATGRAAFSFWTTAVAGPVTIDAILPNGVSQTFHITVAPLTVVVISGDNQTLGWNLPAPQPLVVEVRDPSGAPVPNAYVSFSGVGISFTGPNAGFTNAQGRAQATPLVTSSSGTLTIQAFVANSAYALFTLNVQTLTIAILSGDNQSTDLTDPFPDVFRARVTDPYGVPVVGTTVSIYSSPVYATLSTSQATTDVSGEFTFTAQPSANAQGSFTIWAQVDFGGATVQFHVFARRLAVNGTAAGGSVTLSYQHEHGPQSLILTVDAPQPGAVSTVYGDLWTSVLSPGPAFFGADPTGIFGVVDPGLVANPSFSRTYGISPALAGFTFVAQIIGFDPVYYPDVLRSIFVSNAVTKTL